jgi:hypothetical protein
MCKEKELTIYVVVGLTGNFQNPEMINVPRARSDSLNCTELVWGNRNESDKVLLFC